MTDPIKITSLEAENVKRVRAVQLHPSATGLTIIGGNNNQGKTSLLDTIAWALGGDRFRPSMATREGSTIPPHIKVTLSNGLIVERRGKNSDLKVIDPSGSKAGQQLLNAFIEQLALDLPRFMQASDREKADTLLRIIGVGEQLAALERKEHVKIYGVRWPKGASASKGERIYDSVGMTAEAGVGSQTVTNDFDKAYPFAGRRRCNGYRDADRTFHVTAYEGEPGYTTNDPAKLVYVETPEFYYFDGIDGDYEVMAVSTYPVPGFEFMPRTYSPTSSLWRTRPTARSPRAGAAHSATTTA